jgi:fructokinase
MGMDLGGTRTEVLVLGADRQALYRERFSTPALRYRDILAALVAEFGRARSRFGDELTLGIGVSGPVSPRTGPMRNANTRCPNGRPLETDLEDRLRRAGIPPASK